MSNIRIHVLCAILIGIVPLHSQAIWGQSSSPQITGSIAYHERVALPSDAVIDIQLQDVSIADIAAQVVAETMINAEGRQVPIPFNLSYDPAQIDPSHRYSVRATIRSGDGMLMFTTAQTYPVITRGAPSKVSLMLRTVGHGPKPAAVAKQKPLEHAAEPLAPSAEKQPASEAAPSSSATSEAAPPATPQHEVPQSVDKSSTTEESKPAQQTEESRASLVPQPEAKSAAAAEDKAPSTQPPASVEDKRSEAPATKSESSVAELPPAQPELKAAEAPPSPQEEKSPEKSETSIAAPQPAQPEAKAAETQPAPQPEKPAEKQETLPDSPSTVAGLTQPEASSEEPAPEPEPESRPARPKSDTPLADTQWKLIQLGGVPVVIQPPSHPMTLAFSPEGRRIAGSAGCHSYIGTFTDDHGRLTLNPGEMVVMGCAEPLIKREQKFIAAMRDSDRYRITGDYLVLTGKGKILAKFKSQFAP